MIKIYDRNLKRYFRKIQRDFKNLIMNVVPKVIKNVTASRN